MGSVAAELDRANARADGVRPAAVSLGAADLDAARFGFDCRFPQRSAKRRLHAVQIVVLTALIAAFALSWQNAPSAMLEALQIAARCFFSVAILWRLIAAASSRRLRTRLAAPSVWPTYTILCPLYREANVAADLVAALDQLDYPKHALDVKLLVEGDDVDTIAATLAASGAAHIEVVIVPVATPRTKPKALNAGLARARGAYVTVYDAEDRPHPAQLRAALAAFEQGGPELASVQAPLAIDNAGASWIARQFAAEYAIQFGQILPLLARWRLPLPLGGTSNHFRTAALRSVGGWDPYNVTEDADLGYRLARDGLRAGVIAPPTWEEAPVSLPAWLSQRTRWIKGHLQTWLVLMRNPLLAAREMGWGAFAAMHLVLAGGLIAAFAHGPLLCLVLIAAFLPGHMLGAMDIALALVGYGVAAFAAARASALSGNSRHASAALTMPLYWPLASLAAYRALFEFLARPHHWAKTAHGVSRRQIS